MPFVSSPSDISRRLIAWFEQNGRDLPWRRTTDPYAIWLSEIMLQQTRVEQGMDYYFRFLEAFPTLGDLAQAEEQQVLHLWQGLGYYSRGRNLLKAAQLIAQRHQGIFPNDYAAVRALPGIGDYTAGAIMSFAFGQPHACVDGNVYRVISRLGAIDTPINSPAAKKLFQQEADALLSPTQPGAHNQAMMELGALICTPRNPQCHHCPVTQHCHAYKLGLQGSLPVKIPKAKSSKRFFNFVVPRIKTASDVTTIIRRRPAGDVWQGLYEPPLIETDQTAFDAGNIFVAVKDLLPRLMDNGTFIGPVFQCKHVLTHQELYIRFYIIEIDRPDFDFVPPYDFITAPMGLLMQYPYPKPIKLFLERNLK